MFTDSERRALDSLAPFVRLAAQKLSIKTPKELEGRELEVFELAREGYRQFSMEIITQSTPRGREMFKMIADEFWRQLQQKAAL